MPKINKIKLSGTSYDIQDSNASKTVTLTQAQYDALQTKDPNTFYIISDGETFDPSEKVDTSAFTAYSASVETALSGKAAQSDLNTLSGTVTGHTADTTIHVTAAEKATWNAKSDFSGSYNDLTNKLSAGTNITIVDNVISTTGGGGKAIEAGRGISITTGETADTVSFNLPISAGTGTNSLIVGYNTSDSFWKPTASGKYSIANGTKCTAAYESSIATGYYNEAGANYSIAQGYHTTTYGGSSHSEGWDSVTRASYSHAEGNNCITSGESSHAEGIFTNTSNKGEHSEGWYNVTRKNSATFGDSGNTLFSVGNGTADNARHNAFEIRQNGDIYLTKDGQDVKLQDQLGGGGGSSVVELTQTQYDALTTIDPDTIYVITDAAGGDLSNYYTKTQINAMIGDIESLLAAI